MYSGLSCQSLYIRSDQANRLDGVGDGESASFFEFKDYRGLLLREIIAVFELSTRIELHIIARDQKRKIREESIF